MSGSVDRDAQAWAGRSVRARIEWVRRFRGLVEANSEAFIELIGDEVHKPEHEAITGDLMPLLAACRWHERYAGRILRTRRLGGRALWQIGQRHRVMRVALGKVAIIATWNYPVQLLGVQLVQALLGGNRVVVKPSEHAPRTQELLLELGLRAGLPDGTLEWTEATREAGARLIAEHDPDHVVFTGSTRIGRSIGAALAERLIPSTLELSGCDSAFVLDDADVELAARSIWNGVTMNGGQTCMAPRRALVDRRVYPAFLRALAPLASGARERRLISADGAQRAYALAVEAVEQGGRSISGVCEPALESVLRPLAIVDCPEGAGLVGGDHFGPVLAVVPVESVEHALAIHRRCAQHLTASVYTRSRRRGGALAPTLGASIVMVNDCVIPSAHPGAGLAGHGASGWGVSRGAEGLLAMTRPLVVSRTASRLRVPTDPPDERGVRMLHRAMRWLYGAGGLGSVRAQSGRAIPSKTGGIPGGTPDRGTGIGTSSPRYAEESRQ